jgi:pimeloyl-ACP methyl ester carboxylesterase
MPMQSKRPVVEASDGHLVPAIWISTGSRKLVVLSHGITTNKDEDGVYSKFAESVLAPAFDSVRFDFRGHGESTLPTDQVTVAGEILDFMAVVKWARQQGYERIYHVATSFGASVTLLSIAHFPLSDFAAVVFWNPVISYINTFIRPTVPWAKEFFDHKSDTELAYRKGIRITETDFTIGPKMVMELLSMRPDSTSWPGSTPLLIAHGDRDSCVPLKDAAEYCARNKGSKLTTIPGVDHGFDDKIGEVYQLSLDWLKQH